MQVQAKKSNKKLLIIVLICAILAGGVFIYLLTAQDSSQRTNIPKIEKSKDTTGESLDDKQDSLDQAPPHSETKVENKTPIQYEGEQIDDKPSADDERFRIPEDE